MQQMRSSSEVLSDAAFQAAPPAMSHEALPACYPEHKHTMQEVIEVPGDPVVHLRHVEYADAAALARVVENSRDNFAKYLNWTAQAGVMEVLDRIEIQLYLSSRDMGMTYCVIRGAPDEPGDTLGSIRLFERYPNWRMAGDLDLTGPVAHCGSWIDVQAQGQGIMHRARRSLFEYAKKRWGLEGIFMDIAIDNYAAERSVRALGAVPLSGGYWHMQRPFVFDEPSIPPTHATSATDMPRVLEQAREYYQKRHAQEVLMQRWLLRLEALGPWLKTL